MQTLDARVTSLRLPVKMYEEIRELAAADRRSIGFVLRDLIEEGIERRKAEEAKRPKTRQ